MQELAVRDTIRWHPRVRVDKYSIDQVRYASRRSGLLVPQHPELHGYCGAPELGTAEAEGNLLVTVGLTNLTKLIIGNAGVALNGTQGILGVGAGATTPVIGNTALTDDNTANAWYQIVDSAPTQLSGVITAISTFATSNANFAWAEWCAAVATSTITAGDHLSAVGTSPVMLNHATASLGTKTSLASWVLTATITLS
jgi:hypothetical protein